MGSDYTKCQNTHNLSMILITLFCIKGTRGGVQHGVWTRLHSFFIISMIRESIDIDTMQQNPLALCVRVQHRSIRPPTPRLDI